MTSVLRRALSLAIVATLSLAGLAQAELKVGDSAPDFKLKGSDGKTYALADFKGKQPVVVAWFPKAFTGGWTKQCSALRASAIDTPFVVKSPGGRTFEIAASKGSGLDKYNVAYFTASCDKADTNAAYAKALKLDYPILSDPGGKVAKAYGIYNGRFSQRVTFIIDKDGKIAHVDKAVKVATHGKDVAAKLKELGVSTK